MSAHLIFDGTILPVGQPIMSKKTKSEQAKGLLEQLLSNRPIPAREVIDSAQKSSISRRTLMSAKRELGIKSEKSSFSGEWLWSMPQKSNCSKKGPFQECKLIKNLSRALYVGFVYNSIGNPIPVRLQPGDVGRIMFNKSIEIAIIGGILKEVTNEK